MRPSRSPARRQEQRPAAARRPGRAQPVSHAGSHLIEVARQRLERDLADRHDPLAVALADDPHGRRRRATGPRRSSPSASLTRSPQAYSSSSSARSRMPTAVVRVGRVEQRLDLVHVERVGQLARRRGQVEQRGDVAPRSAPRRSRSGRRRGSTAALRRWLAGRSGRGGATERREVARAPASGLASPRRRPLGAVAAKPRRSVS